MNFFQIILLMLPIILIAGIGYFFSLFKKSDIKVLADLIIYVTAPCLFIMSLSTARFHNSEIISIILTTTAVVLLTAFIVFLLRKYISIPLGMYIPIVFMNSSFIGFPLILMAYGTEGLARAIIFDTTNGLLIYSLGIYIISNKSHKFEFFKTPILYSAIIGTLINIFNIQVPEAIGVTITMLGSATIPLALFMLGMRLGKTKITSLKMPLIGSLIRGLAGIGIAVIIVKVFNIPTILGNVLILMSALPSAITGIVLSEEYKKEHSEVVASTIALSTLLAIIYMPLLIMFLK